MTPVDAGSAALTRGRPAAGRPAPGAGRAAGARGGLSQSRGQADVRSLIEKLNRDRSPTKRRRPASPDERSDSSDQADDGDEQLTPIQLLLRSELQKQTALLTERFDKATESLKQELRSMHERIGELEQHVNEQGDVIHQLQDAVNGRDRRLCGLEDEVEDLRRVSNIPFLIFDGPGVPTAPKEFWKEDVTTVTKTMLQKYIPSVEVGEADIRQCYRADRGKKIVCEFTRCGPGSVRDTIHDARVSLSKNERGQKREAADQIYISEKLTPGASEAHARLRSAKKRGEIHSVYTHHGCIYVRVIPYGRKIRVSNRNECERVLRGEQ